MNFLGHPTMMEWGVYIARSLVIQKRLIENFIRNHNVLVRMMASKDFIYLLILLLSIEYNMVYMYIREWCN